MTKTLYIILVTLFLTNACSQAQEGPADESIEATAQPEKINTSTAVSDLDQPKTVPSQGAEVAFKKQYPKAEGVSWAEDANGYHEANFTMDGENYRADYTTQGKWVETENSLKFGKLPKAVQQVVNEQFDKDDITEIEQVNSAEKGLFYDVEFKDKGKNKDIEIREDGVIIKQ